MTDRELSPADRVLLRALLERGTITPEAARAAEAAWAEAPEGTALAALLVERGFATREALAALDGPAAGGAAPEPARATGGADIVQGYRILDRLGRGGMGSVFRAHQASMNRIVALKILRRPLARDEQQVERLRREARFVGSLDHPNIVRGLDVGQSGPYHYFAMEFVEGESLRDRLQRGPVPEAEALRIIEKLCDALDHAHSRAVVHRDVKPGNIIVAPDGEPKLTDYGLAKGPSDFALTQSGVTIGTPQYISPEQARDPSNVDIQTDLYSLGATAYHMLAGVPPHTSDTLAGLLTKVLYEKPRTVQQVNPRLSAEASFLVEKLMAKKRQHRYATPREVLHDLRRIKAGRTIVPRNWSGDFEVQEVRLRARLIIAAFAAVVVAGVGLTAWLQKRHEQETRLYREDLARRDLSDVRNLPRRGEEALRDYRDRLREFVARHAATEAAGEAMVLAADAERRLALWSDARGRLLPARDLADNRKFRKAMERIDEATAELMRAGGDAADEPVAMLAEWRRRFQKDGQEAAEAAIVAELSWLERVSIGDETVTAVETRLRGLRAQILEEMVDRPNVSPVQDIDRRLEDLNRVNAAIADSIFGEGFAVRHDEAVAEGRYRDAEESLEAAGRELAADAGLALLLVKVPRPVAEWYRRRVPSLLARVEQANRDANRRAEERAQVLAAAGRHDDALAVLEDALAASVDSLRPEVEEARAGIARARDEGIRAERERVEAFRRDFVADLGRRDYFRARLRVDREQTELERGPHRALLRASIQACRLLLDRIENVAFERVRAALRQGDGLGRGLRFDDATRIPYDQVANVRIEDTPTGSVVVFDAPGQPGLRQPLALLSLSHVLHYARLDGSGLDFEDALLRGALVVADGEAQDVRGLEAAATLLVRARDQVQGVAAAVDALLERCRDLVKGKLEAAEDLENTGRRYVTLVHDSVQERKPKDALNYLDLLDDHPLSTTRIIREKRAELEALRATARRMLNEQRLEGYYPGVRVTEKDRGELILGWSFDTPEQRLSFVPPEDALPPFHDLRIDPPVPPAAEPAGRVVFVAPPRDAVVAGRRRELADSPLVIELPVKVAQGVSVGMRVRWPERALFLQVCIAGNNLGVLSDDGRLEGGRGVWAWQRDDWRDAFEAWPDTYRHNEIHSRPGLDLDGRYKDGERSEGIRYFQFEADRWYDVLVEWRPPRMRLAVDGREIWVQVLKNRSWVVQPPRLRVITFTPMELDDLEVRGLQDHQYVDRLLRRR